MEKVYIETTIPSYLAARPSPLLMIAARQQATRLWWETQRHLYALFSSEFVRRESEDGDPDAARRRLAYLDGVPELAVGPEIEELAKELFLLLKLPAKAELDAYHLAVAISHRMDYILTWNCTHLANASLQKILSRHCVGRSLHVPVISTPEMLIPNFYD